jgi:hypothetical protein
LAHASEPYVSRIDFMPSLGSALKVIEVAAQNLRRTVMEPLNYEARYNMMYASYMAAQSFNSGGLGIIHAMSHAISAYYDTHHGLNNAVALTRVWEYNMPTNYKRFRDIARAMGENVDGLTDVSAGARWRRRSLSKDVGVPANFFHTHHTVAHGPANTRSRGGKRSRDDRDVDRITKHLPAMVYPAMPGSDLRCRGTGRPSCANGSYLLPMSSLGERSAHKKNFWTRLPLWRRVRAAERHVREHRADDRSTCRTGTFATASWRRLPSLPSACRADPDEGPAGVGKTELAIVTADALERPLIRL